MGHDRKDLKPGRTLEAVYLDPLRARVERNGGTVYGQPGVLSLLVDVKEDGAAVQRALRERLPGYARMLSDRTGTTVHARAVQIVLSGARTESCAEGDGFIFKDGTLGNLADEPFRTPWISASYLDTFRSFLAPLPPTKRAELDLLVTKAHDGGKRLRFWAAPDGPAAWGELRDAGVDLLNTDHLASLRAFLLGSESSDGSAPR